MGQAGNAKSKHIECYYVLHVNYFAEWPKHLAGFSLLIFKLLFCTDELEGGGADGD